MSDEAGAIAFAEKVLALLGQGRFTTTYSARLWRAAQELVPAEPARLARTLA